MAPGSVGQRWFADRYAKNARFVADLAMPMVDLLAPAAGERILDLGCGDGALSEAIAARGGRVVAVDSSPDQVQAALRRGLDAHLVDGERLSFAAEFDAVFSNAALHWMKNLDAALAGVGRALVPGGRFVAEMGGAGNVATIERALRAALARRGIDGAAASPWIFPEPADLGARLARAGFAVRSLVRIERPTPLPGPLADWLDTFGESFLFNAAPEERAAIVAEVVDEARATLLAADGRWIADYVRLRFVAVRPSA
ncbi:MAG: methyltransferase domain-containing protein [Alphaproteobacteria bacterium]|nr:methyltransferase domain-containing protein [Alphaproteobacteria bacterium]